MPLYLVITLLLGVTGMTMVGLWLLYMLPGMKERRIREQTVRKPTNKELVKYAALTSVFSITLSYALPYAFYPYIFIEEWPGYWVMLGHTLGILALYEILYYSVHRYLFHGEGTLLWKVHAVHHVARSPTSLDALYLHPIETFIGLALLVLCTYVVGPVHIYVFGVTFFLHSWMNVVVHSGLDLQFFPFRTISYLARKHNTHHINMKSGNYASLTPICDIVMGTSQ